MEKRYQVFISSTYEDLKEERTEVIQALLELDCFPAGMELFPASNESQWNWIKRIIDESDYYLLILGGRYGTISNTTNTGYVEMEYKYAIECGKPTIAFIHENIDLLPSGRVERDAEKIKKYYDFRKYVETKLCKKWNSVSDLGAKVSRSITQLIKTNPATGWVRADMYEKKENDSSANETSSTHITIKRDSQYSVEISYTIQNRVEKNGRRYWRDYEKRTCIINLYLLQIFKSVAKEFLDPQSDWSSILILKRGINSLAPDDLFVINEGERIKDYTMPHEVLEKILLHYLALGYFEKNRGDYKLTDSGKLLLFEYIGIYEET